MYQAFLAFSLPSNKLLPLKYLRQASTVCLLTLLCIFLFRQTNAQQRFQADWDSLKKYETPDWFCDAKFGIFIHWGVYSVPAFESEWYPHEMYKKDSKVYKHH